MEIWKDVVGFEGYYQVSNTGHIKSLDRKNCRNKTNSTIRKGRILKPALNKKGYLTVVLTVNAVNHTKILHRLIAAAFIENPDGKATVNHKNGIKTDNNIDNLEWATNRENYDHAVMNGLHDNRFKRLQDNRRKVVITKEGIKEEFESIKEASFFIGTSGGAIGNVLNGSRKSIKGFSVNYV